MNDEDQILQANEAFYRAFSARDMTAMDAVWAKRAPVACIHPGWGALVTRESVMTSWQGILSSQNAPNVTCRGPRAFVSGDAAFVICFEMVEGGYLIATNIFTREDGAWRMTHHQAGPTNDAPPEEKPAPAKTSKTIH
ncbi:MAG: nuclear transport factor 2 family protein [Alphaproteobacteria bacterium]|nr:nuclear transport factor 2 family protein [Alphaproteobacteria bacterium]